MATVRGLRHACPNCKGNVQYFTDFFQCLDCFWKEDLRRISPKQRAAIEAKLENIPVDIMTRLSVSGRFFLKEFPELVKGLKLLDKMENGDKLTDEENLYLRKCGFIETYGRIDDENT